MIVLQITNIPLNYVNAQGTLNAAKRVLGGEPGMNARRLV